jgi:hypothetical protein
MRIWQYGETPRAMIVPSSDDGSGWTEYTPAADSRIMYVSPDGNDSNATVYNSLTAGNDPFEPSSAPDAFATYAAAEAYIRPGYPDWVLFERGGEYNAKINLLPGRSATEQCLLGAYGSSGNMPIVKPLNSSTFAIENDHDVDVLYCDVTGIDFYHTARDPNHADYQGTAAGATGIFLFNGSFSDYALQYVRFEGCRFRFYANNSAQRKATSAMSNITFFRCVFSDNYSNRRASSDGYSDGSGHSQGMYASGVDSFLFDECLFIHSGWYHASGEGSIGVATQFNHNTYISNCTNVTARKCSFIQGSSGGNKWRSDSTGGFVGLTVTDNLYLDNEIGISCGDEGNSYGQRGGFQNVTMTGNVITESGRSNQTDRNVGWYMWLFGWDGGSFSNNYIIHEQSGLSNVYGLRLQDNVENAVLSGNIIYGIESRLFSVLGSGVFANNEFSGNILQDPVSGFRCIEWDRSLAELTAWSFSNNEYLTSIGASSAFEIGGSVTSYSSWESQAGETGSSYGTHAFVDATRNIASYHGSLGLTATVDAYIASCRSMGRYSWDSRFTAEETNAWIKAGFANG